MQTHRTHERDETADRRASTLPAAFGVALALATTAMIWLFPPTSSASNLHRAEPAAMAPNLVSTTGEVDISGAVQRAPSQSD